jgi:hypothetical protein
MIKHVLIKANCFEWVHFGEYVDIKRKGRPPTARPTIKTKIVKKPIKKQNDDEEEETSEGEEDLDEDTKLRIKKRLGRFEKRAGKDYEYKNEYYYPTIT